MKPFLTITFLLLLTGAHAQELRTVTRLPAILSETSGIEASGSNRFWSFNDSGGEAALYQFDTLGNLLRTVAVTNAWNRDWEDIAQDGQGNFYIGNIGNNDNNSTDLTIFKIPNPDAATGDSVAAETISFSYEDQYSFPPPDDSLRFDCEALFWHAGHLYLCTKNRTVPFDGKTHLYRLPDAPGEYIAEKIGTFDTGGSLFLNFWITAADISPDGSRLCLLSSDKMWVFYGFTGDDFFGGQVRRFDFPPVTQKEAVCFLTETELYITDEELPGGIGRNLYAIRIPNLTAAEGLRQPENRLSIFPNPCRDWLTIEGNLQHKQVEVFDARGVMLQALDPSGGKARVNVQGLPGGSLFIPTWP